MFCHILTSYPIHLNVNFLYSSPYFIPSIYYNLNTNENTSHTHMKENLTPVPIWHNKRQVTAIRTTMENMNLLYFIHKHNVSHIN